jgi:cytochrome c
MMAWRSHAGLAPNQSKGDQAVMAFRVILSGVTGFVVLIALAGPASAAGDPAAGEKAFKAKCGACHNIADDKNKIGPTLKGVYGRKAGEVANFKYSDAMKASGVVWNDANLASYLKDPKGFVAGNKMTFVGIKDEQQIADVIAYIKQTSGN